MRIVLKSIFISILIFASVQSNAQSNSDIALSDGSADAMYFYNRGDFDKALKEFIKRAKTGDAIAEATLGRMYRLCCTNPGRQRLSLPGKLSA